MNRSQAAAPPADTPAIVKPIFVIGMGRSGTTLMLEAFSARSDLAWFSRPLNRFPRFPVLSVVERLASLHPSLRSTIYRSDQIGPGLRRLRRLERVRLGPTEGISVWRQWFGERILSDYLLGVRADEQERRRAHELVRKLLRYQGKDRFVAKLAAPGHVTYLSSIFDDALFVHVIRDGRAVVNSLMNFPDWRDSFRRTQPAWRNGVPEEELARWRDSGGSPYALAAIQWRTVIETNRHEAAELEPGRYTEARYEDLVSDPHRTIDELTRFCGLPPSAETHAFLDRRIRVRDMNYRWREELGPENLAAIEREAGGLLRELGYVR